MQESSSPRRNPYLVLGAHGAAIYDFTTGKVYSINRVGRELLLSLRRRGDGHLTKSDRVFLTQLQDLGLSDWILDNGPAEGPSRVVELDHLDMEVTASCNLRCVHCYGFFGPVIEGSATLALEKQKSVLDEARQLGCRSVQFIGGEATTSRRLLPLIRHSRSLGFKQVRLYTNGSLIDEEMAHSLAENHVVVRVSLYSNHPKVHDQITGVQGSFERTVLGIMKLKIEAVDAEVAMVVVRHNQRDIDQVQSFVEKLGVRWAGYDPVRPVGRGRAESLSVTDSDLLKYRIMNRPNFRTSWRSYERYRSGNSCWLGQACITSTGDVLPCVFSRNMVAGTVKTKSLQRVIDEGLSAYWYLSRDRVETCSKCEYRYCCFDCRPLAVSVANDLHAKGGYCTYDPAKGLWSEMDDTVAP